MVTNCVKVTINNLHKLYARPDGNIYFRRVGEERYEVNDGWEFEDLFDAMCYGQVELIWIAGPSLGTEVEVED
jgi:hypothetical protein